MINNKVTELLAGTEKWKAISTNLYDELCAWGTKEARCMCRHDDGTKDCLLDYTNAMAGNLVSPRFELSLIDKWKTIAGNLYDELRARGKNGGYGDCLVKHDGTKDCLLDYEDSMGWARDFGVTG
jgi:hypothetical protein